MVSNDVAKCHRTTRTETKLEVNLYETNCHLHPTLDLSPLNSFSMYPISLHFADQIVGSAEHAISVGAQRGNVSTVP
jgi:hypothetical protein